MNTILALAKNTFRQAIRDKILYGIIIFGFLFIGSTAVLGSLAIEEELFIVRTVGLAGIYLFGLIITIFLGASLIYNEINNRTTYMLLAKPVTRTQMITGKFLGLYAGVSMTVLLMTVVYLLVITLNGGGVEYRAFGAVIFQLLETGILLSALIFFSTFTTPLASAIYTLLIIYIGHSLSFIIEFSTKAELWLKPLLYTAYYLLPNLEKFNIRGSVVHDIGLAPAQLFAALAYAAVYTAALLYFTGLLFNRKDL